MDIRIRPELYFSTWDDKIQEIAYKLNSSLSLFSSSYPIENEKHSNNLIIGIRALIVELHLCINTMSPPTNNSQMMQHI